MGAAVMTNGPSRAIDGSRVDDPVGGMVDGPISGPGEPRDVTVDVPVDGAGHEPRRRRAAERERMSLRGWYDSAWHDDGVTIALHGVFGAAEAEHLRSALTAFVSEPGSSVELDLDEVEAFGVDAVDVVAEVMAVARAVGSSLRYGSLSSGRRRDVAPAC